MINLRKCLAVACVALIVVSAATTSSAPDALAIVLVPLDRGILATIYVRVSDGTTEERLADIYHQAYAGATFVRAVGTAGSVWVMGEWSIGTSLTAFSTTQALPVTLALRTVALDTTAAQAVAPGAVWGASSASNTIKVNRFSVRQIN